MFELSVQVRENTTPKLIDGTDGDMILAGDFMFIGEFDTLEDVQRAEREWWLSGQASATWVRRGDLAVD